MSRRRPHHGLSLFPFLDVLMCTMGSLILLLLVSARNIHRGNHDAVKASVAMIAAPVPAPAEKPAIKPAVDPEQGRRALEQIRQQQIAEHRQSWDARQQEIAALRGRWEQDVAALQNEQAALQKRLAELRSQVSSEAAATEQVQRQRNELQKLITEAESQSDRLQKSEDQLIRDLQGLDAERDRLQKELQASQQRRAVRKPRFEIVAYDGASGTERRPILVECRADRLVFAAEQISLSARDLEGFTPEVNPLRSGSEALLKYWAEHDQADKASQDSGQKNAGRKTEPPYLLLIVRPGGTVGFYVARKMLEKVKYDYGYELVYDEEDIQWPAPDPGAVRACEEAIRASLEQKQSLPPQRSSLAAREQRVSGNDGLFHLAEIDDLKSNPDSSFNQRSLSGLTRPRRDSLGDGIGRTPQQEPPEDSFGGAPRPMGSQSPGSPNSPQQTFGSPNSGTPTFGQEASGPQKTSLQPEEPFSGNAGFTGTGSIVPPSPDQSTASGQTSGTPASAAQPLSAAPLSSTPRAFPGQDRFNQISGDPESSSGRRDRRSCLPLRRRWRPARAAEACPMTAGARRKWGQSRPTDAIGIEQEVTLHLYANRIRVSDELQADVPLSTGRTEFQDLVSGMLQQQALAWGRPPEGFYWRPMLKVVIHPGGNQHYPRLKELVDHWSLTTTTEQTLD